MLQPTLAAVLQVLTHQLCLASTTNFIFQPLSFAMGTKFMVCNLHCTPFQPEATLILCIYWLRFAVIPLFSTALSKEVGRRAAMGRLFLVLDGAFNATNMQCRPIEMDGINALLSESVRSLLYSTNRNLA